MTQAPRLPVDEYERAALLREALQEFTRTSAHVMRAHGLTIERYQLLLAIKVADRRGEPVTVRGLAERLRLAPSTVTQLVRRAENLGLVRREHAQRDARIRHLRLTDEGERRLAGAVSELREDRTKLLRLLD